MAEILLIEDVPVVRSTLLKFLERGGYVVTACASGNEAWPLVGQHRFEAVITDIWMTDGDGLDFIQRLRSNGDLTPVIAITGGDPRSPQASSADIALRTGADRVLLKPVTKAVLLNTISEIMSRETRGEPS